MKKIGIVIAAVLTTLLLVACASESSHTISYVGAEKADLFDQYECIAIYTQYINDSDESGMPADYVSVKAFQNGVELPILVPTGERTNNYVQCDTIVQGNTTADVVWYFQLDDESDVLIEITGNESVTVSLAGD